MGTTEIKSGGMNPEIVCTHAGRILMVGERIRRIRASEETAAKIARVIKVKKDLDTATAQRSTKEPLESHVQTNTQIEEQAHASEADATNLLPRREPTQPPAEL